MIEQVKGILSNFIDVEVAKVDGEDELVLVFHTEESLSQSIDIAYEINKKLNGDLLYGGDTIQLKNSHEDIWYGILDIDPDPDSLYPMKFSI